MNLYGEKIALKPTHIVLLDLSENPPNYSSINCINNSIMHFHGCMALTKLTIAIAYTRRILLIRFPNSNFVIKQGQDPLLEIELLNLSISPYRGLLIYVL